MKTSEHKTYKLFDRALATVLGILLLNGCSVAPNSGRSVTFSYGYGSQDTSGMNVEQLLNNMRGMVSKNSSTIIATSAATPVGSVYPFPNKVTLSISATSSDGTSYTAEEINKKYNDSKFSVESDGSLNISYTSFSLVIPNDSTANFVLTIYTNGNRYFQGNLTIGPKDTIGNSVSFPLSVDIDSAIPVNCSGTGDSDGDGLCDSYEDMFINAQGIPDIDGDGLINSQDTDSDGDGQSDSVEGITASNDGFPRFVHFNNKPTSADASYSTDMNTPLSNIQVPVVDPDVGDNFTISLLGNPAHGSVSIINPDLFSYTPDVNFTGTDSFQITASDQDNASVIGTISITVNDVGNHYPTATGSAGVATYLRSTSSSDNQTDAASDHAAVSTNGRFIAFWTNATNLGGSIGGSVYPNLYLKDTQNGTTTLLTPNVTYAPASLTAAAQPSMAQNGRYIFFVSPDHSLDPGTTSTYADVYRYDAFTSTILNISSGGECASTGTNGDASEVSASQDGNYFAFTTMSTTTPGCAESSFSTGSDTNGNSDIYLFDLSAFTEDIVSTNASNTPGDGNSYHPSVDNDGSYVAFVSTSTNLISGQNSNADVYLKDTVSGTLSLVSWDGSIDSNGNSDNPSISGNGRYVAFESDASNLVSGDTNGKTDIFLWSSSSTLTRVSVDSSGNQANGNSYNPQISKDGRYVVFESDATNLVANDTNNARDLFLHDTVTGSTRRLTMNANGTEANAGSTNVVWSGSGQFVVFTSSATNLDTSRSDANAVDDIFAMSLTDQATTTTDPITTNILSNYSDADGDPLSISAMDSTSQNGGAVTINGNGTANYVATGSYQGLDSYQCTISDGNGGNNTATVYVSVEPNFVPIGTGDSYTTTASTAINLNVLSNDYDANGDTLSINSVSATGYSANGSTATINGNTIDYLAPNISSVFDSFTYTIKDSHGAVSQPISVNITIN